MEVFYIKTRVLSGIDALSELSVHRNKKLWIVCDRFLVDNKGITQLLKEIDDSNTVSVFSDVVPEPPVDVVAKGLSEMLELNPDVIIAFGGGSAIDTAKGILYFAHELGKGTNVKFIAIPTTSGTGSEVTAVTVLTDTKAGTKQVFSSEKLVPDEAILDARLTLSVPPAVTANTGMDVLVHAIEAYVARGSSSCSDAFAEKAVELAIYALLGCYRDGSSIEYRTRMHEASTLAGMAFNSAGLGMNHAIAHQLGALFHIPHGLANALLVNAVIEFNTRDARCLAKYAKLARKSGLAAHTESDEKACFALVDYLSKLKAELGIHATLAGNGVSGEQLEEELGRIVEHAMADRCMPAAPVSISEREMAALLRAL